MNRKITLPTVCWNILKQCLATPGWATTYRDISIAGRIDEEDKIKIKPAPTEIKDQEEWGKVLVEIEWTEKEIDTIKRCLPFCIQKGYLFPNKSTTTLLSTFLGEPTD